MPCCVKSGQLRCRAAAAAPWAQRGVRAGSGAAGSIRSKEKAKRSGWPLHACECGACRAGSGGVGGGPVLPLPHQPQAAPQS